MEATMLQDGPNVVEELAKRSRRESGSCETMSIGRVPTKSEMDAGDATAILPTPRRFFPRLHRRSHAHDAQGFHAGRSRQPGDQGWQTAQDHGERVADASPRGSVLLRGKRAAYGDDVLRPQGSVSDPRARGGGLRGGQR